jgi:hypothetical protein
MDNVAALLAAEPGLLAALRELAVLLSAPSGSGGLRLRQAVVASVQTAPARVTLTIDGGSVAGVRYLAPYAPIAGDTTWLLEQGSLRLVIGQLADTGWITVTSFSNSWASYGSGFEPQYRKVGGIVYVQGTLASGTVGNVPAFTLPAGYRPSQLLNFPIATHDGTNYVLGAVNVLANGEVRVRAGSNVYAPIPFSFVAAA